MRVRKAKYLFPDLSTLVAPMFPEPIFLMSFLLKILVKIRPKGIDPQKYEKTATKIISIICYALSNAISPFMKVLIICPCNFLFSIGVFLDFDNKSALLTIHGLLISKTHKSASPPI